MTSVHGAIIFLISLAHLIECKNPNILVGPMDEIESYLVHLKYAKPEFDKNIDLDDSKKREICEGLLDSVTYEVLENEDYTTFTTSIAARLSKSIWPSEKSSIPTKSVKFELNNIKGNPESIKMPAVACFVAREKEWYLIPVFNSTSPPHHLVLQNNVFWKTNFQLYGIYHKMDRLYVTKSKVQNLTADDCFLISHSKLEKMYDDGAEGESLAPKIDDKTPEEKFSSLNKLQRNFLCSLSHGAYSNATQKNFRMNLASIIFIGKVDEFSFPLGKLMIGGIPKHQIKIMACSLYARSLLHPPEYFYLTANLSDYSQIFVVEHINGTGNDTVYELVAAVKGPNIEYIMSH